MPRRLLIEPLLTNNGDFPGEYKFFVFNGIPRVVMHRANYGDQTHERTQAWYDMQWRLLPIRTSGNPSGDPVPRPREFDCDHVRVDFLVSDGCVYVGELTSYHRSGFFRFEPDAYDFIIGQMWKLRRPFLRASWTIITRDWNITD